MKIKRSWWFGLLLFMTSCVEEPELWTNTPRGNFEALWSIIDKQYCYLDYKQIDWDSIHSQFIKHVDLTTNQYQLFDVLSNMLLRLKDGHVNLTSSFNVSRYWNWYTDYPSNFNRNLIFSSGYLGTEYKLSGGFAYQQLKKDTLGYIYLESFNEPFNDDNIDEILHYFRNCKGLILDVRDNGGGALSQAERLAAYFFKTKTLTGYISHKVGDGHADFSIPQPLYTYTNSKKCWNKPVVILTNRMCYSATNAFVSKMKYAPNAIILGDSTGGGGGLPMSKELPNGWIIRYSASPFFDAEMHQIESGVRPTILLNMQTEDIRNHYDTYIERAASIIETDSISIILGIHP